MSVYCTLYILHYTLKTEIFLKCGNVFSITLLNFLKKEINVEFYQRQNRNITKWTYKILTRIKYSVNA